MPPAFDTATTTSRACENANSGNSMPRRLQIGVFIMSRTLPAQTLARLLAVRNFRSDSLKLRRRRLTVQQMRVGINRLAAPPAAAVLAVLDLEVQMRDGRVAGHADIADHIAL